MKKLMHAGLAIACVVALTSCAKERFANVPDSVVDDCRREAALLTEPDPFLVGNDPIPDNASESGEVIEDARTAESEEERVGLAGWPEDVLVYRCLASQGAELTPEQAAKLANWERRLGRDE